VEASRRPSAASGQIMTQKICDSKVFKTTTFQPPIKADSRRAGSWFKSLLFHCKEKNLKAINQY
jgi:hypothetical protein